MKKLLLVFLGLAFSLSVAAQCSDVFISEYVEGSHNNKAIELYNPTNSPIDLTGYSLLRYSNGSATPEPVENLSGVIAPGDAWVIVIDKQDPNGTGYDTIVFDELRAKADTFIDGQYSGPMYFNGNDAITLEKNSAYVDIIGVVGQDPGLSWTCDTSAGFTDLNGGRWMTRNHTLIRKSSVEDGVTANPNLFNPCAEWDSLPINTFDHLGWHDCNCHPNGLDAPLKQHEAFFFPNPVKNSSFLVKANGMIQKVELINIVGQTVVTEQNNTLKGEMRISTNGLSDGMYMVKITFDDNQELLKKIIIE